MDHETLEQQTAPESTRGLFDPPEIVSLRPSSSTNRADKRRSLQVFGQLDSKGSKQQNRNSRGGRSHQRSKSASITVSNHDGNRRNTNFGLHTLRRKMMVHKVSGTNNNHVTMLLVMMLLLSIHYNP